MDNSLSTLANVVGTRQLSSPCCVTKDSKIAIGCESRPLVEKTSVKQPIEALRQYLNEEAKRNGYVHPERTSPGGPDPHHHRNAFNNIVEAKSYGGRRTMQKRIHSQSIIKALAGYDLSSMNHGRVLADASRFHQEDHALYLKGQWG
ncbi:hypothetical protein V6N12_070883 [Hibiscus sabdariffa]|uniref:Uncharacterized protein n=1 Tax=Hibiscus sabdariffa TaxID=183260 RepID=A0ABR2FI61_9ROSI